MIAFKFLIILSVSVVIVSSVEQKLAKIDVTSRAISSIIDILSDKQFMRFVLVVEENDGYLGRLAD